MSDFQNLTRCLLAAGGAMPPDGQGTYLLYEEDNDLIEKLWTGSEIGKQTFITSGVKKNTPASYLLKTDKRLVFCIDESNTLKCHEYNDEEEEWEGASLGEVDNITVHPESRLSACFAPDGITVFFQDPACCLKGIVNRNGSWELLGQVPAKPLAGTPHSLIISGDNLHLFYMSEDNSMHYQVKDYETGAWKDHILENSRFDTPVARFLVAQNPNTKLFEAYFLTAGVLIQVEGTGKRMELGKVEGDKFVATTSAECVFIVYIPILVFYPCRPVYCYCW